MPALTKLHTLRNIGLFENGTPQTWDFSKANLIYAENGRGKTTLATVLRSCSENDAAALTAKKTLDNDSPPKVGMLAGISPVVFEGNAWSASLPNIVIFDGEFVERNVYTGHEVRPDQRQSLLEFVLGDSAVAIKQAVDKLTADGTEATKKRSNAEAKLNAYRGLMALKDFRALPEAPNLEQELESLKNQIAVARQQQGIAKRPNLTRIDPLSFDLDPVFSVLKATLLGIQKAAEASVKSHVGKHTNTNGLENWIALGQSFVEGDTCPFCGQGLDGLDLVTAYQSYFNAEYNALKGSVAGLHGIIANKLPDTFLQTVGQTLSVNRERLAAWSEQLPLPVVMADVEALGAVLTNLRTMLSQLADKKKESPLDPIASDDDRASAEASISEFNKLVDSYNAAVNKANSEIAEFKDKLAAADVATLEANTKLLEMQKVRHSASVVNAFAEYDAAETCRKDLEQQKSNAREQLDTLMGQTLTDYRDAINHWLVKFGAAFSVEEMKPNYLGGGLPRTEYGLKVRERSVKLGARGTSGPSFGNTLSEGDKRTLAFAFFLARLFQRPDRGDLIVVVDDPVSSLDKNRRNQTKAAIGRIASEVGQLFVLTHDAYFLQGLERYLTEKVKVQTFVKEIKRVAKEYSAVADCDLDILCASDYYHHYVSIHEFAEGVGTASTREVSKALRLLLEGHLHRRFPKHVKDGLTLGKVIDSIRTAANGSPLEALKAKVPELIEFNDFSSRYHHDTNPAADTEAITDAELLVYAKQALKLIHTGGF
jgi:wobble nucleotide-excising tRNase